MTSPGFYSCEHRNSNIPDECFPRNAPTMDDTWHDVARGDASLYPGLDADYVAKIQAAGASFEGVFDDATPPI